MAFVTNPFCGHFRADFVILLHLALARRGRVSLILLYLCYVVVDDGLLWQGSSVVVALDAASKVVAVPTEPLMIAIAITPSRSSKSGTVRRN